MATSSIQSNTTLFDQIIFTIINDLKNKHKRADVESIHKEIAKKSDFKDVTKEDLEERINVLLIDEKLLNKINRNLNSYSVNTVNTEIDYETTQLISSDSSIATPMIDATPRFHMATQTPLNDSETPITNSIPDFSAYFLTPEHKTIENAHMNSSEKYIDRIYEKVKIENFKDDILKNLRHNIKELFDNEFTIFKSKCEELVETSSLRYNKQIDHLQNEIKSKDKIIDQLIISLTNLTNSELESKNRIIHKLIDTNNNEENQHSVRHQHQIDKNVDAIKKKSIIPECSESDSIKKIKEHVEKTKVDNLPNKIKSTEAKAIPTPKKKIRVEILGDSMVNGIQEKSMNKDSNMIIKIRKYPGASSTDVLDHIKPSLRKDPDQILIHAGTNDLTNDKNYLKNVKKIVKLVRETCKDTKLCFSSLICRTDVPDIDEKVIKTNTNLENYCNQQNIGFISNNNIKKSDLNARGLHLHERGSSKLAKNFLDYLY